jgi:hypothetical protein
MVRCLVGLEWNQDDAIMYYLSEVNSTWKRSLERMLLVEVRRRKRNLIPNRCLVVLLTSDGRVNGGDCNERLCARLMGSPKGER